MIMIKLMIIHQNGINELEMLVWVKYRIGSC